LAYEPIAEREFKCATHKVVPKEKVGKIDVNSNGLGGAVDGSLAYRLEPNLLRNARMNSGM